MKPTSIPEHNRTAEILKITKADSATETIFHLMVWPFIMLWKMFKKWKMFKNWWEMYE